jgi:hypothetical protein
MTLIIAGVRKLTVKIRVHFCVIDVGVLPTVIVVHTVKENWFQVFCGCGSKTIVEHIGNSTGN